jgi:hypothetical protein
MRFSRSPELGSGRAYPKGDKTDSARALFRTFLREIGSMSRRGFLRGLTETL